LSVPNPSLVNWPTESGFFTPSATFSDYYMLQDRFEALEQQLERLEHVPPAKLKNHHYRKTNNIELKLYMLRAALEVTRSLVREYSKRLTIETNFTFRLKQCEKRANHIFSKLDSKLIV